MQLVSLMPRFTLQTTLMKIDVYKRQAQLMVFVNAANKEDKLYVDYAKGFIQLIAPFAPHLAEELWQDVYKRQARG